uniref:Uncharacterized protein n=1 Tax=Thermogemmatispora argillosa TaxID=2045280 RepID=A0A455T2V3_9CHLR|nr:hypothetical protein KTA_17510 [Thermogemmatispora argillosa]
MLDGSRGLAGDSFPATYVCALEQLPPMGAKALARSFVGFLARHSLGCSSSHRYLSAL